MEDDLALVPDCIIRPFRPGDATEVRRLIEAVWQEHFGDHPDPFAREFIHTRLGDVDHAETAYGDRALFLCATVADEIVGTGAIRRVDDRECELTRMFLTPAHRGRGIGQAIAQGLIRFARTAGYQSIRLSSNKMLAVSHRLYERLGFRATSPWEPDGETHSLYYRLEI
ncbi:GNAT family N-acetyltransferase [Bradyrhizobium viridifuturi]|mgnify:FL=1|jgi:GNAT superfamily N-acetyltransferase|uniref:GNAT family N-acetyltransferase n=1 Tax=Bradyrhizobium TaxID=374 RepID=UPI0003968320|nr:MULTISPECIES: GNAT family N-acetyltransferase [Bradyrhizobium]ERF84807.1 MAG: hypothetical protein C207_01833 [Bradyrhizobium sp. DFCI-1]OYU58760.1 MAG: N-acetyltransferase [Bradyrhizobium sp. PARBB1]PSO26221.1 N-acetyltransferase [Bradyrhizobium sp. MOS004]QRI71873.1 GNAT family N-acetyltransferase [Bradyrhizobium sp. PSBB068]MBR1023241.1 GNAT family N-acetyltransferase [Bradyrhizobium viridifuturi]